MADAVAQAAPYRNVQFTVTSRAQLEMWSDTCRTNMRAVPNGVDCDAWHPSETISDYWTWAGRIVPNKGLAQAVAAARIAGVKLRIYGPIEDVSYFADRVEPLLCRGRRVSRAMPGLPNLPRSWHVRRAPSSRRCGTKPFGLVAAEALACGVPVVGVRPAGLCAKSLANAGIVVPAGDVGDACQSYRRISALSTG